VEARHQDEGEEEDVEVVLELAREGIQWVDLSNGR
jgi:hypothetical protein